MPHLLVPLDPTRSRVAVGAARYREDFDAVTQESERTLEAPTMEYLRSAVSNGNPKEQALIRRWWHEVHGARGCLVWEYYLEGCYLDAVWFPEHTLNAEVPGAGAPASYPISGIPVVLCEAKSRLTAELIGQALVYGVFARRAGALVRSIVVFAETVQPSFKLAAEELGLEVALP